MQSVGTRLKEARIEKGYTLEDINVRTRISLKNLYAIEADDLSQISSPFTYRSFVKQVADTLDTDFAALSPDVQAASCTMPEPLVPGQEEEVIARPHQFQPIRPKRGISWISRTISIVVIVAAVSGYLIWRNGGIEAAKLPSVALPRSSRVLASPNEPPTTPLRTKPIADRVLKPAAAKLEQVDAPGTGLLSPPQAATDAPAQPVTASAALDGATIHIELSAVERTWLSIASDGKTTYIGILEPSQTKVLDGKESARIRTANAGGVNVVFNGRALGPLGRPGQPRTFVFTKDGYEVVQGLSYATTPSGG